MMYITVFFFLLNLNCVGQLQEQDTYAAELKLELDALKQISIQYTRMCDESRRKELLIVDAEAKNQFLQTQLDTSTRTLQNLQLSHDKTLLAFRRAEDDRIVLEESVRKQFKQRDTEIENQVCFFLLYSIFSLTLTRVYIYYNVLIVGHPSLFSLCSLFTSSCCGFF